MRSKPEKGLDEVGPEASPVTDEVAGRGRRICFAIETLEMGGAENHAVTLAEYLARRGWQVVFAVMRRAGMLAQRCRDARIEVRDRLMPGRRGLGVGKRFGRLAAEWPFDTLFVIECFYLNALIAYWVTKRRPGTRAYAIIHNWPSRRQFSHPLLLRPRVALMNRVFDRTIFISERQRRHYEQVLGIHFAQTNVIASGVDVGRFVPATPASDEDKKSKSEAGQVPLRVGIVASLQPRKGHDYFLRAAAEILRHRRDVEFLVIGDGPRRDELRHLARNLNIEPNIEFLGLRGDVPDLLRSLDVLVLASHEATGGHAETLPLVLMEAGATALPAVATNVGAVSEIVIEGQTGFLVPQRDFKALAEKIERLLSDPRLRERMGRLARERVVREFNALSMCRRFEQLFLTGQ